jgi:hypothetical protein
MKKKVAKIVLVLIMVLGIAFSLSNFVSIDLHAAKTSVYIYRNGVWDCIGLGNECDPFAPIPPG